MWILIKLLFIYTLRFVIVITVDFQLFRWFFFLFLRLYGYILMLKCVVFRFYKILPQ